MNNTKNLCSNGNVTYPKKILEEEEHRNICYSSTFNHVLLLCFGFASLLSVLTLPVFYSLLLSIKDGQYDMTSKVFDINSILSVDAYDTRYGDSLDSILLKYSSVPNKRYPDTRNEVETYESSNRNLTDIDKSVGAIASLRVSNEVNSELGPFLDIPIVITSSALETRDNIDDIIFGPEQVAFI
ncbi:unnamed protein product [Gordionus sp. m RMFG-2023]